ncbi:MAG: hypothetical protein JWQ87_2948 [Candidatus Sulfotelmatobacter sp.]|nr:hypothetical protein [Candidatus Sulfotelmatobacter sp.]
MEPEIEPSSPSRISLWPLALLGTLLFALLPSKRNQPSKSVHPQDSTHSKNTYAQKQTVTTANIEPTPENSKHPYRGKDHTPLWKKLLEGSAVTIAFGLLVVNICQMRSTEKAAQAAQDALRNSVEQFRADERAWVEIEPIKPVLRLKGDSRFPTAFTCSIYPKNVGKTVATDIVVKAETLGRSEQFNASEMASAQDRYLLDKYTQKDQHGNVGPATVPQSPVPRVIAPNSTANAPFILICPAIKTYPTGGSEYEFVVGRIDYCDAFNVHHWKKFCFYVTNDQGDVWNCSEGNLEDVNSELEPTEKCQR